MMVYLSAGQPLRLVEPDGAAPALHVSPLIAQDEVVRKQFRVAYAVYAGAYEGCGCGFQYGEHPAEDTSPQELASMRRSLDELARYVRGEIARVGDIEVYACWDGDQESEPQHRRRLSPAMLETNDFFFRQKELSVLVADSERAATPLEP